MLECVDVEVHFVVGTVPVVINAEIREREEDVVHRSYGD